MSDSFRIKIKDAFKKFVRYELVHTFICIIMYIYINIVYKTSQKIFKGDYKKAKEFIKHNKGILLCTWHGRILVSPAMIIDLTKGLKEKKLGVLASKHKDGQLASKTIRFFNFKEIFGSSINKIKGSSSNKGGISAIRNLIKELRNGRSFCIAPDGPRGPARKVNGEIINIARLVKCPIFPVSLSCSRKWQLNTWDNFQIFFPFSKIIIDFGSPISVYKDSDVKGLKKKLENTINQLVNKNDKLLETKIGDICLKK
jgi:lysophospholipid acyltransferase (LPLAT)-like uncharacterized protein